MARLTTPFLAVPFAQALAGLLNPSLDGGLPLLRLFFASRSSKACTL
jgi:hypothetical protein